MRYLGGKSKIAKRLSQVILDKTDKRERLIEPFIGGGAMTAILAPNFKEVIACDLHEDLIIMWNALKNGWVPPSEITEEQYKKLKEEGPSALRAFAGFGGASWGGKWFGGYARGGSRNYADESKRSLLRDIQKMMNVDFQCRDYKSLNVNKGDVVYCDPPYEGTTQYRNSFDSKEFWFAMHCWVEKGAKVFVSEYNAPPDWKCVWEKERTRDMKSKLTNAEKVTERLFTKGGA